MPWPRPERGPRQNSGKDHPNDVGEGDDGNGGDGEDSADLEAKKAKIIKPVSIYLPGLEKYPRRTFYNFADSPTGPKLQKGCRIQKKKNLVASSLVIQP